MRDKFTIALLLLCLTLMTIQFKNKEAFDQTIREYEIERQKLQDVKEALEKEIRLLKTDIYILENGFEGENQTSNEIMLDK